MSDIRNNWTAIKKLFYQCMQSSMHASIASVSEIGQPHVTPIGSLMLAGPGHGYYFEAFTSNMPRNFKNNSEVCVLVVNSSKWFWFRSLLAGRFLSPPGIRLRGTVGSRRTATDDEIRRFQQQVKLARGLKGHRLMWANMTAVRDIEFVSVEPIKIGKMTRSLAEF
jgi:hypothetical protein